LERLNVALRLALREPKVVRSFEETDLAAFSEQEQTIAAANSLLHQKIVRWGQSGTHKPHRGGAVTLAGQLTL
jgi:hypothetical protein